MSLVIKLSSDTVNPSDIIFSGVFRVGVQLTNIMIPVRMIIDHALLLGSCSLCAAYLLEIIADWF